jgi:hypothetical protein
VRRFVAVLLAAGCGGTPCPPVVEEIPMTAARAQGISPEITTGFAASTTNVFGDCRTQTPPPSDSCGNVACVRRRESMAIYIVPVNLSLPNAPACRGGFAVADLVPIAERIERTSEIGELVVALEPGSHLALLSADGICADCGNLGAGTPCLFDVERGLVTARDLVLDRSTR